MDRRWTPHKALQRMPRQIQWPESKSFAFTIFDDPDHQSSGSVEPVYSLLSELGLRTTASVWPLRGSGCPRIGGVTCEDRAYRKWLLDIQRKGFEIGLHNATYHTSSRQETNNGLERFKELFGHYPHSMANHTGCREGMYWGRDRLTGMHRWLYDLLHPRQSQGEFEGHIKHSPLFWGDLCSEKVRYVRNFTFSEVNTLKACPMMPYHDPDRPLVQSWFAATEGPCVTTFTQMLSEENQDRLAQEGGACIMYTHFAQGFMEKRRIHQRFEMLLTRLSRLNGWFVPVHTLLDFLATTQRDVAFSIADRSRVERRWLLQKMFKTRGRS